jgi:uncharacterized protein (TIGR02145 family)
LTSATICAGEAATLTAVATGAASYSLDGSTWTTSNTFTVDPTTTTYYTLYAINGGCTASLPNAATVTVNDPTELSLTASPDAVCAGKAATLTAAANNAASYSLNGSDWQTSATFTVNPTATTYYTLYAINAGCTASLPDAATVTVNDPPSITLTSSNNSQTVSIGTAIADIEYTTTNASGATVTGLPSGVSDAWANNTYTISGTPAAIGISNYTVTTINGNGCANATATGAITVTAPANQGGCTFIPPPIVSTFKNFPSTYSGGTFVTLTDERDDKNYTVVKIGDHWIMAQNLNYQKDLTWQTSSKEPSTVIGYDTALIGHFWCPGGSGATTSTLGCCDVWGALYSWETAMSLDGKGTWSDSHSSYCTGAASTTNCKQNWGRTATSSGTGGRGICPENWHVPTDFEWGVILDGMESKSSKAHQNASGWDTYYGSNAGSRGKAACTGTISDTQVNWVNNSSNNGTDAYGFRVLPAGRRTDTDLTFSYRATYGFFWTSSVRSTSTAAVRYFIYNQTKVNRNSYYRAMGHSVRCIRN